MSNMVYLITSLPSLTFGQVLPISIEEFNRDAKSQLSARHFRMLESVDIQKLDGEKGGLRSVETLVKDLRYDLSEIRNAKAQNRKPKLNCLPEATVSGNPLDREKKLMQWQWEELDAIETGKTFTFTEVVVYKLKLQILCRLNSFDKNKGTEVLTSFISRLKNEEDK